MILGQGCDLSSLPIQQPGPRRRLSPGKAERSPPTGRQPAYDAHPARGPVAGSGPSGPLRARPPPLTAAVALWAAGTMAGSGADMLLPHITSSTDSACRKRKEKGALANPRAWEWRPGPPHRAQAEARARQDRAAPPSVRSALPRSDGSVSCAPLPPVPLALFSPPSHSARLLPPPNWRLLNFCSTRVAWARPRDAFRGVTLPAQGRRPRAQAGGLLPGACFVFCTWCTAVRRKSSKPNHT